MGRKTTLSIAVLASLSAPVGAAGDPPKDPVILLPPAPGGEADGSETIPPGAPSDEDLPDAESGLPPPPPEPETDYVPEPPPTELPPVTAVEAVPPAAEPVGPPADAAVPPPAAEPAVPPPAAAVPPAAEAAVPPPADAAMPPPAAERAAPVPRVAPAAPSPVAPAAAPPASAAPPPAAPVVSERMSSSASMASTARHSPLGARRVHRVAQGESLWSIAERLLGPTATAAQVAAEVERLWRLNRDRIGTGDPDLLPAGITIVLRGGA